MYYVFKPCPCQGHKNSPNYYPYDMYPNYNNYPPLYEMNPPMDPWAYWGKFIPLRDYGPNPFVIDIEDATEENTNFRLALWTGEYLQLTLMSIDVGEDIGLEVHQDDDQFLRIEDGEGLVLMGDEKNKLDFRAKVGDDYVILIPAGKWHNIINTGNKPLKLYSIYAPPEHPHGTVHRTKEDAEEHHY